MAKKSLALLMACAMIFAACGDDDASTSGGTVDDALQPYADALIADFDPGDDNIELTEAEVACFVNKSVVIVGIDRLEAIGDPAEVLAATADDFWPLNLEEAEYTEMSNALFDCSENLETTLREDFVADLGDATDEQRSCIEDKLTKDTLVSLFAVGLSGDENFDSNPAMVALGESMAACQ